MLLPPAWIAYQLFVDLLQIKLNLALHLEEFFYTCLIFLLKIFAFVSVLETLKLRQGYIVEWHDINDIKMVHKGTGSLLAKSIGIGGM